MTKTLLSLLVAAAVAPAAHAASFTAGDVAIYRVGTGTAALTNAATAVFIDEYTASGSFVQSIAVPTAAAGANAVLTASGTATSEGLLTRSADGSSLVFAGYNATVGTVGVASTTSANVARVVGVLGASGAVDTTTSLGGTNFSANNVRSVASTDGNQLWISGGTTGIVSTVRGATGGTVVANNVTNNRELEVFNGQLYSSTGSGSTYRIGTVGTGTPNTSGSTIANLPGSTTTGSPYAFFLADLNAGVAGLDTLYVADDAAGLLKYSFDGTAWNAQGAIAATNLRGLTGSVAANGTVTLFGTSDTKLVSFSDTSGSTGALAGSLATLATAGANTAFRGVALAPTITAVPEPQTYAMLICGLLAVGFVARRRS